MEWPPKPFPFHENSENITRTLKSEVLKITPEEGQNEQGETEIFFKAVAIVGDFNGNVGLGVDWSIKPTRAAKGSITLATANMVSIRRGHWGASKLGHPHTIFCKVSSTIGDLQVRVNPAPRGTGITGPVLARKLLEFAGVQDAYVIVRGMDGDLAILCQAILMAVKETFVIFQDKILQTYNVKREEACSFKPIVAETLPFNQPKGSCGNLGLFIPEIPVEKSKEATAATSLGKFCDFVPGAKAHPVLQAVVDDEDKENNGEVISAEEKANDAKDVDTYISEINQISSQLEETNIGSGEPEPVVEFNAVPVEDIGPAGDAAMAVKSSLNPDACDFKIPDYCEGGYAFGEKEADNDSGYYTEGYGEGNGVGYEGGFSSFDAGYDGTYDAVFDAEWSQSNEDADLTVCGDGDAEDRDFFNFVQEQPQQPLQPRKRNPIPIVDPNAAPEPAQDN